MTANQHKERGRPCPRERRLLDLEAEEEAAAFDRLRDGTTREEKGNSTILYDRLLFYLFIVSINLLLKILRPSVFFF